MVTPSILFGYQDHLLSSAFSVLFETVQKYPRISTRQPQETQVPRDAQNVCPVTKVGTVLKISSADIDQSIFSLVRK